MQTGGWGLSQDGFIWATGIDVVAPKCGRGRSMAVCLLSGALAGKHGPSFTGTTAGACSADQGAMAGWSRMDVFGDRHGVRSACAAVGFSDLGAAGFVVASEASA
jgi:hypothetical protein